MAKKQVRFFTLLEVMLVIAIVAIVASATAIYLPKALQQEGFEKEVATLRQKLELAQEVMIDYNSDVLVSFKKCPRGYVCSIFPAKPLPEKLLKALNEKNQFEKIKKLEWQNSSAPFALHFVANEGKTPCGMLVMQGEVEKRLFLPGYVTTHISAHEKKKINIHASYPQETFSPS